MTMYTNPMRTRVAANTTAPFFLAETRATGPARTRTGNRRQAKRQIIRIDRRLAKVDVATRLAETMEIDPVIPEVFMDLLAIEAACGEGFALSHLANDNWPDPPAPIVMTRKQALVQFARAA